MGPAHDIYICAQIQLNSKWAKTRERPKQAQLASHPSHPAKVFEHRTLMKGWNGQRRRPCQLWDVTIRGCSLQSDVFRRQEKGATDHPSWPKGNRHLGYEPSPDLFGFASGGLEIPITPLPIGHRWTPGRVHERRGGGCLINREG